MAHRTDVHIVQKTFKPDQLVEMVTDPACGRSINQHDSRNIVFRKDETIYFCSPECKASFLEPSRRNKPSSQAA